MTTLPRNTILAGDVRERLAELPTGTVDSVITSPPYYQLRDYGVAGQLGLEPTVTDWVAGMRDVCRELARVLKPTGSLWLNLGDSFSRHARYGAPPKGLLLAPERLLIALAADGWIVRNKVIWAKPNSMPVSVSDRLAQTYEVVFFLVRARSYFFDLDAIREPFRAEPSTRQPRTCTRRGPAGSTTRASATGKALGKNPGDVWTLPIHGYRGAHFATFPPDLIRRPLLATCPELVCTQCGVPWLRAVTARRIGQVKQGDTDRYVLKYVSRWRTLRHIGDLIPCGCDAPTRPGVVLDPFFGAGTTGLVAQQHHRDWLGIELNPDYRQLARHRLGLGIDETAAT
jgi:site-specific DNA-methyltransferase (adenine-specific)